MRVATIVFIALVGGVSGISNALAFSSLGAASLEHPEGLSLRQESAGRPGMGGFFIWYGATRGHVGGGLRGGK